MANSTLSLDTSDPDIEKVLQDCDDGMEVEFTVSGTLDKKAGTVDVTHLKYTGADEGSTEEEAAESPATEAKEKADGYDAPAPKGKKMAPAVAILVHAGGMKGK